MTVQTDLPIGAIIMWGGTNNVPGGWLLCDGSNYLKSQYKALHHAIGDNFGPCSDTTHFCVPDLRGRFVRGVDSRPSGNDPDQPNRINPHTGAIWSQAGSLVGSYQADAFRSHTHGYTKFPGNSGGIASGQYWEAVEADTGATGGSETRPVNLYLHFIIKAQ